MNRKKLLSLLLALVMVLSAFPISAFAAPASDIPDKMLDNSIVRALAYIRLPERGQPVYRRYGACVISGAVCDFFVGTGI